MMCRVPAEKPVPGCALKMPRFIYKHLTHATTPTHEDIAGRRSMRRIRRPEKDGWLAKEKE